MKKYKYTFLSLIFAVLFIMGSIVIANVILRQREMKLLSERGDIKVESPVREWESGENRDENADGNDKENSLSMKQVEEAVKNWNNRTGVILHEQVAGQISMKEAIQNGEKWLAEMKISDEKEKLSFSVNAELGVGRQKEDTGEREAYFSFWTVTYVNQSMNAVLYLNAVTGNVWGAEIKRYGEQPEKSPGGGLQLFVKLAGLQAAEDAPSIGTGGTETVIKIKGSRLYAHEQLYEMTVQFENGYEYLAYQLLAK